MITIIAVVLFIILCPCISYIYLKKKMFPWSGGIFLILDDNVLMPMTLRRGNFWELKPEMIVKGIYFAGARLAAMPEVAIDAYYQYIDAEGGVKMIFHTPFKYPSNKIYFSIIATHPFKSATKRNTDYFFNLQFCWK